ncbi:transposase [Streptomyces sp. NPDC091215]|uniref:transposase n=1 Tax=Streptomyces sp. NPDC091215 TaxID=3155192 RepID=UPI003429562C
MSLQVKGLPEIPEETARVAWSAFPKGSLAMSVRDQLGKVFADELFAEAFGVRGAPGLSRALLSLVTVLQFTEDLTDRQAATMAVRAIDWKYAMGMELSATGFDDSVLARFRARLVEHGMERLVFDRLLEWCREQGLVGAGGRQRTDSTHVISAVRDLNRLELAGESVRAVLEALAVVAPVWLAETMNVPELALRYGERVSGWKLPSSQVKRERLATVFGQDALALLRAVWAPTAPPVLRTLEPVALLRRITVQTYLVTTDARGREVIRKREAEQDGVPPGHLRLWGTAASLPYVNSLVQRHCGLIVSVGPDLHDAVTTAARHNPRQQFIIVGSPVKLANVRSFPPADQSAVIRAIRQVAEPRSSRRT